MQPLTKVTLCLFGVFALIVLLWAFSPVRYVAYAVTGRSDCPPGEAARAFYRKRGQLGAEARLQSTVRVIGRDAASELWETPMGRFWMPKGSSQVIPEDMAEQEVDIYGTAGGGIRPGDVVLDCGANVGLFVRKALDQGAGLVVAIEPGPENLASLRRNLSAEIASGRVVVYPKGVWDKPDTLTLRIDSQNSAADTFVGEHGSASAGIQVPLVPIDQLVDELRLTRVDFIKMDIEGAERKALAGARGTLARFRPRLAISSYHLPGDVAAIDMLVNAARGDYRRICGSCSQGGGRLNAEVLWFR